MVGAGFLQTEWSYLPEEKVGWNESQHPPCTLLYWTLTQGYTSLCIGKLSLVPTSTDLKELWRNFCQSYVKLYTLEVEHNSGGCHDPGVCDSRFFSRLNDQMRWMRSLRWVWWWLGWESIQGTVKVLFLLILKLALIHLFKPEDDGCSYQTLRHLIGPNMQNINPSIDEALGNEGSITITMYQLRKEYTDIIPYSVTDSSLSGWVDFQDNHGYQKEEGQQAFNSSVFAWFPTGGSWRVAFHASEKTILSWS